MDGWLCGRVVAGQMNARLVGYVLDCYMMDRWLTHQAD